MSVEQQTITFRKTFLTVARALEDKADTMPPGWKNNVRWHVGHLIWVPQRLILGLRGDAPLSPPEYGKWFGKDTSPADWAGAAVPPFGQLLEECDAILPRVYDALGSDAHKPNPEPYKTTPGVVLACPADAITFSFAHDGIHMGLLLALRRALA